MDRPLRELVEELIALGDDGFRDKHRAPVLICRDLYEDDDRSFHTAIGSGPGLFETLDSVAPQASGATGRPTLSSIPIPEELPEQTGERVYFIRKRAGGAFRERVGVGRAPNVDVSITLPRLSKYHAYFVLPEEPDGEVVIADAGSKNGTWVDGRKVDAKAPAVVSDGCTIRLGPYHLTYHTPDGLRALLRKHAAES